MPGTPSPTSVSTKQARIAELARQMPETALTSLSHHVDLPWLLEAYKRTRKDGATGVDGQTAEEYAADLEENLRSLLSRAKSGTYRAPPVRRTYIPKAGSAALRPIGIPTFEDKVLQRAVVMALEPIYEGEFYDFSYGFRPGRSAHQALERFRDSMMDLGGGWVVEVDIKGYFDSLVHRHLRQILSRRVRDGVLSRLVGKWLHAGVMDDGSVSYPEAGTPQGGVVSPLLANVYLHEVLDKWFATEVLPRLHGRGFIVRYADDFVMGFSDEQDARRVLDVLAKRMGRFGLTLHPEKTRLVRFARPPRNSGDHEERDANGTFDFLGFTHLWARTRWGNWAIRRKTAKSRMRRALRSVAEWCRAARHLSMGEQHKMLSAKVRGHCEYYGITGNSRSLAAFRWWVWRTWRKWLLRRSQRCNRQRVYEWLTGRFKLPQALAVHSIYRPRGERFT